MHTGDGGYLDDEGFVYFDDRIKDMIVTGGENVYSAVIGIPDEKYGELVHAVVVLLPETEPSPEELRAFVKEHIAGYKAPRSFSFVTELPMSGAGKILKRDLRAQHTEQPA